MKGAWFGFIFFVALVLLLVGTVLIGNYPIFGKRYEMTCRFPSVEGLREGDDVRVDGVNSGKVRKLKLDKDGVVVTMETNEPIEMHEGYEIVVESLSLLGGGVVSVRRGDLSKPVASMPPGGWSGQPGGTPLAGLNKAMLRTEERIAPLIESLAKIAEKFSREGEDAFYNRLVATLDEAKVAFQKIGEGVPLGMEKRETRDNLRATIDKAREATNNINEVFAKINSGEGTLWKLINEKGLHDDAKRAIDDVKDAAEKMKSWMDNDKSLAYAVFNKEKLADDVNAAAANIKESAEKLNQILDKVNKGEGTVGKLVNEDGLYSDARETLKDAREAMKGVKETFGELASTDFRLGGQYLHTANKEIGTSKLYMEIWPEKDHFFRIGVTHMSLDADGDIRFDDQIEDGGDSGVLGFDVLAGMQWRWWFDDNLYVYAGVIESAPGIGGWYEMNRGIGFEHPLDFIFETRMSHHSLGTQDLDEEINGPLMRAYFRTPFWTPSDDPDDFAGYFVSKFHVFAGGSNLLDEPEFMVGLGFEYSDKHLKSVAAFGGSVR